jgi:hypothetical protein
MTTQHFFLTSAAAEVPVQWRQALQAGQVLNVQGPEYKTRILQTEPAGPPSPALVAERLLPALTGTSAVSQTAVALNLYLSPIGKPPALHYFSFH